MPSSLPLIGRRALILAAIGGAAVSIEAFRRDIFRVRDTGTFRGMFRSPFFALERGSFAAWRAQVGQYMQIVGGPMVRVVGVEPFVRFGRAARGTVRDRAFLVTFATVGTGLQGEAIYRISSTRAGQFDLYMTTSPSRPGFAQAMFN